MAERSTQYASLQTVSLRQFFDQVFIMMGGGLFITAMVSWLISHDDAMMASLFHLTTYIDADGVQKTAFGASGWWWFAAAAQLLLVVALSWGGLAGKLGKTVGTMLFAAYAGLTGLTLAPVIYAYTDASVVKIFLITATMFGGAALWGITTKIDLRGLGTFFLMSLIGLLVALVVNIFFSSPLMDMLVSGVAVLLFAALTAFDMQKLEEMFRERGAEPGIVTYGALTLYLDFINMFIHLLRIFGTKK